MCGGCEYLVLCRGWNQDVLREEMEDHVYVSSLIRRAFLPEVLWKMGSKSKTPLQLTRAGNGAEGRKMLCESLSRHGVPA
jgi:hypothetical protein